VISPKHRGAKSDISFRLQIAGRCRPPVRARLVCLEAAAPEARLRNSGGEGLKARHAAIFGALFSAIGFAVSALLDESKRQQALS
jgi:hypothetical protein